MNPQNKSSHLKSGISRLELEHFVNFFIIFVHLSEIEHFRLDRNFVIIYLVKTYKRFLYNYVIFHLFVFKHFQRISNISDTV